MNPSTILRPFGRVGKLAAWALTAAAVGVVASLLVALAAESAAGATGTCAGKQVSPGDDLAAVAEGCGPGSTFYVGDGSYSVNRPILVSSDDVWAGVYSDSTRPQVRGDATPRVFDAGSSNGATIRGLAISGGDGTVACQPTCGRGVHGGFNLLLQDVRVYENDNQGVGGQHPGLVIRDSELDHNGIPEFYEDSTYAGAAGVKSVNSFAVYDSYIHDNAWNGVWCDLECDRFEVHDSRIVDNGKSGVFYEVSAGGAVVEGNYFARNGQIGSPMNRQPAGLSVTSSRNLEAYGNTFAGNNLNYGFWAIEDGRAPDLGGISFHDNTMNGDALRGCDTPGVTCNNNNSQTPIFDGTAPGVSTKSPAANAERVEAGANVRATFDEAVTGVDGSTFVLKRNAKTILADVSYNAGTRTATLDPRANLAKDAMYTVTLTSGIKDEVGNSLARTEWSFTTRR